MEHKKVSWKAEALIYKGNKRIAVYFESTPKLDDRIKKLRDARWSSTLKFWHLPDNQENRMRFKINCNAEESEDIKGFIQWLRSKRYSESSIKTYTNAIKSFLRFYENKPIHEINNSDIISFRLPPVDICLSRLWYTWVQICIPVSRIVRVCGCRSSLLSLNRARMAPLARFEVVYLK